MFAAPRVEVLENYLSLWEDEEGGAVSLMSETTLPMETTRRRALGKHPALLVDVPWTAASSFRRPARTRSDMETFSFQVEGVAARPEAVGAQQAAKRWVSEAEDALLAEYVTAESEPPPAPEAAAVPSGLGPVEDTAAELARLRARLAFLEGQGPQKPLLVGGPETCSKSTASLSLPKIGLACGIWPANLLPGWPDTRPALRPPSLPML